MLKKRLSILLQWESQRLICSLKMSIRLFHLRKYPLRRISAPDERRQLPSRLGNCITLYNTQACRLMPQNGLDLKKSGEELGIGSNRPASDESLDYATLHLYSGWKWRRSVVFGYM